MTAGATVQVRTLGVARISVNGVPVDLQGKSLALVAYLAVEGESTREALAELLWPEQEGDTGRRNLRVQLHRLRQTEMGAWLVDTPGAVRLHETVQVDVQEFRQALASGEAQRAAAFVKGTFLDHLSVNSSAFEEWREATASTLRDEQWRALDACATRLTEAGQFDAALSLREQAVRLDPLRERSVRALMELLLQRGQFDAAHNAYVNLARRLQDELGMNPLPATQALRERIERQREDAQHPPPAPSTTTYTIPLVGREAPRQQLLNSASMLVLGEAGLGKSRLVEEVAGHHALLLRAAPELMPLPFGALFEFLRTLNPRDVPTSVNALLENALPAVRAPADRAALLDTLAQALGRVLKTRTLIVEDIHWIDVSTLECVFLALFRGVKRVWLTARPGEVQDRPEVQRVLRARHTPQLTLTELTEQEVGAIIERMAGQQAPLFSRRLHSATAGNPLFLVETLRGLRESGELNTEQGVWQTPYDTFTVDYAEVPVPESVTAAISERVERLGAQPRQLLQAGALWGEQFPTELVAAVNNVEVSDALGALERAEMARLVVPDGVSYRFGHDLYRRVIMHSLGGPRTRFLHSQLARLAPAGTPSVQLAEHHERAGETHLAWPHWQAAAQEAERLFSHQEAISLYGRALADLPPDRDAFDLHLAVSQLQRHTEDLPGQTQSLKQLKGLAQRLNDPQVTARCARRHAVYHTECDEYEEAVQEAQQALSQVGHQISSAQRSELLLEGGAALACLSHWSEAHDLLLSALEESRATSPTVYANTLYWVGYCRVQLGDAPGAEAIYREALELMPAGQTSRGRVLKLWKHGLSLRLLGRLDEARQQLEAARIDAETMHATSLRGVVLAELGQVLLAQGDQGGARHLAELAAPLVEGDKEGMETLAELQRQLGAQVKPSSA